MTSYTDSRLIALSADTADIVENGSKLSSCGFNLSGMLNDDPDILYTQISVQSAQIPISYYIVNIYNNILIFQVGTSAVQMVAFTTGNYNASSFITEFNSKTGLTMTLNKINGKLTIKGTSMVYLFFNGSTCFKLLGLSPTTDYTDSIIDCPYPCQFQGITRIKIISNQLATYSMDSTSGSFSNVLASISVNSGAYGILLYDNASQFKAILRPKSLNYIDIGLLDDDENFINFNNVSWHMTLQLDITRKLKDSDRSFPTLENSVSATVDDKQPPDENNNNNLVSDTTTGDNDLDLLMYQKNIYQ